MTDTKPGGPLERYGSLLTELRDKAANAARRNKPTMWAYYLEMVDGLERWFLGVRPTDGGYAGAALALSQKATTECPRMTPAGAARLWALGIYARRILAAWGAGNGGPVSLKWLHDRVDGAA